MVCLCLIGSAKIAGHGRPSIAAFSKKSVDTRTLCTGAFSCKRIISKQNSSPVLGRPMNMTLAQNFPIVPEVTLKLRYLTDITY